MFHPLRALDARTAAADELMRANGFTALRTGRWARTYRLDPAYVAERERVAAMGRGAVELHALAFPQQHAELQQRIAAQSPAVPAPAPALPLDRLAAALADRMGTPDRLVFERLTVERGHGGER